MLQATTADAATSNYHPVTAPVRIQRKRAAGWKKPPNTVIVTRPGKWGNPFYPGSGMSMGGFDSEMRMVTPPATPANCVKWFRIKMETMRKHDPHIFEAYIAPLRGKNLACWCKPGDPCHADILLKVANRPG